MVEEGFQKPIGYKTIKKGGQEYYQSAYEGEECRRFVNSNKVCVGCLKMSKCYQGRHALVLACEDKVTE